MEIPGYEPFYLNRLDELRAEIARLGLEHLPIESDLSPLSSGLSWPNTHYFRNRFCAQPMTGHDARPESGSPSELTLRRYRRYAEGGFGLIWVESTFAGPAAQSTNKPLLRLHEGNVDSFHLLVREIHQASPGAVVIVQLTNAPLLASPALLTDTELDRARGALIDAADLATQAGFQGVDIQASHGSLPASLLGTGGSFDHRTRFLREVLATIRSRQPGLLLASRLCAYEATRGGFGVDSRSYRNSNPEEPARLVKLLREEAGLDLLNVTAASPNLTGRVAERPFRPRQDWDKPDEHPLQVLDRQLALAQTLRQAAPGLLVVGSGFSWLRQFLPEVAAGAIALRMIDFAGLGRSALACPDLPNQVHERGEVRPESTCMVCFACNDLHRDGEQPVGCVVRDSGEYGPAYQQTRRMAPDRLAAEARRCHFCEATPCVAACPTGIDIPAFIRDFLAGDEAAAWKIIHAGDVLPELTSRLSPGWLYREGACIETALSGKPVPISDLQYAVSWRARDRGETGLQLPDQGTGKRVAIVGGGPAGIAAAIRLLEGGFEVDLFERAPTLGGTPERVIPAFRFAGAREEIDAVLRPALDSGHLRLHLGQTMEGQANLDALCRRFDAVLLAAGFWQEKSLHLPGEPAPDGVLDALTFLERAKRGEIVSVPRRVAILSGGDCAMDAARTAKQLGAEDVFVVFGGPRSSMHWHMPEDWFATPGVHALMHCRPLCYETGPDGKLWAVRILHTELRVVSDLFAGLIVEAMGLGIEASLKADLAACGVQFTPDGRVQLRAPGSFQTHASGIYAAGALINGGDTVARCVSEGMQAADCIRRDLLNL